MHEMRRDGLDEHMRREHGGLVVKTWMERVAMLIRRRRNEGKWTVGMARGREWKDEEGVRTFVMGRGDFVEKGVFNWCFRYVLS